MKKHVEVILTDEELNFLKKAKKAKLYGECKSINEVLKRMLLLQLREDIETCDDVRES